MKEELTSIVEKSQRDKIIPFLRSLTVAQKVALVPVVNDLVGEYMRSKNFGDDEKPMFGWGANEHQIDILLLASFVCLNKRDFQKVNLAGHILREDLLDQVIDWYRPEWFSDFVNELLQSELLPHFFRYKQAMLLVARGVFHPSKEFIAAVLPIYIYDHLSKEQGYLPERLLEFPQTFAEHVWILFELESDVGRIGAHFYNFKENKREPASGWKEVFLQFTASGHLDRMRVLLESLQASNRNFNKVASGWFIDLFAALQPDKGELLSLQQNIVGVLSSSHSKPVNTALKYIHLVINEPGFNPSSLIDHVPRLLVMPAKNIVTATLAVLEQLLTTGRSSKEIILPLISQALMHADAGLQSKVVKLLSPYREDIVRDIPELLSTYESTLLSSARKWLMEQAVEPIDQQPPTKREWSLPAPETRSLVPIAVIDSVDDLVFLASSAFDNSKSWHIDVLPVAMLKWLPHLKENEIALLAPSLQRALRYFTQGSVAASGELDRMLAMFVIDVCLYLVKYRKEEALPLRKLLYKHTDIGGKPIASWEENWGDTFFLLGWTSHGSDLYYFAYRQVLLNALHKINKEDVLPIVSTPTHEPSWLDAIVLVDRLYLYQQAGQWPESIDLQIAVSRCYLHDVEDAVQKATTLLKGEYSNLCLFLLHVHKEPCGVIGHPVAWIAASLARQPKSSCPALDAFDLYTRPFEYYAGQPEWEIATIGKRSLEWNKAGAVVEKVDEQKWLQVKRPDYHQRQSVLELLDKLNAALPMQRDTKEADRILLPDILLTYERRYFQIPVDFPRLLMLMPNNTALLLSCIINPLLGLSRSGEVGHPQLVVTTIQVLHELWDGYGHMVNLFLAAVIAGVEQTAARIAGEIWLEQTAFGKMDNKLLGNIMGTLLGTGYAPVKRFTDLVHGQLMRASASSDRQLQVLLEHTIAGFPNPAVTNCKKLLETYLELLELNQSGIVLVDAKEKLQEWKNATAVKKIVTILLNK